MDQANNVYFQVYPIHYLKVMSASMLGGKDIICYSAGFQLELQGHGKSEHHLISSSSYSLSESNEHARFLE